MIDVRTMALHLAGALLGLLLAPSAFAQSETRHAALVVDANTGAVLHEQFADAKRHPASLTKMMTLYLVFDEIEQGRLSFTTKITVSEKAASVAPSKLDLDPGDEVDLIDAIKALITKSANDMAVAVAERIGGTEAGFVRMMNNRARQIGMRSTLFTNASGLPDTRQVTTARDMVTLALHLQDDFPRQYPLFALKSFEFRGKTYRNHNTLLYGFPGIDGIKTGYTKASGFNLVSSVRAEKKHLVAAVFGGVTASARNAHMRMQLFRALEKASTQVTRRPAPNLVARVAPAKKPAPQPAVAAKPAVEVAAAAQAAPQSPRRAPDQTGEDNSAPAGPAADAAEPARTAPARPDIDVLKVRKVSVSDLAAPGAAPPASPPGTPPAPASAPAAAGSVTPKLDLQALRAAISSDSAPATAPGSPPSSIEDIISGTARPSSPISPPLEQQVALASNDPAPATTAAPPPSSMGLGRPPSSLDAQAAALDTRPAAGPALPPIKPAANEAAARFAAAPIGRGYEIQIGAYSSAAEAESRMSAARTRATGLLEGHRSMAQPVQRSERRIFRARFTGFDEEAASNACLELRRLAIDCFVMKAD